MSSSTGLVGATAEHSGTETTVLRFAAAMLRPAMWSTLVAGLVSLVVAGLLAGVDGAVGAVAGTALVIGCCWLNVAVMRWTAAAQPVVVMAAGIAGYCTKFLILLGLLIVLRGTDLFDMRAFGLSVLVAVSVWTLAELLGFARAKVSTVTPDSGMK